MDKTKKPIPVRTTIFWGHTATGMFWIGAGIAGMFEALIGNILNVLFLAAGVAALSMVLRIGRIGDDGDEMSEYNYIKAKADAGSILHIVLGLAAIASVLFLELLQGADISWSRIVSQIFFVIMGIYNVLIGLIFKKLEAE